MTGVALSAGDATEQLALLLGRVLGAAEVAAAAGDWSQVEERALDVLTVSPGDTKAQELLHRARERNAQPRQHRAPVTFLFSDIVGWTPLSARLPLEAQRDVLHLYRTVWERPIERLGGRVLQYEGDGICACFGLRQQEGNAERSVLAALEAIDEMAERAVEIEALTSERMAVRVGIHTGMFLIFQFEQSGLLPDVISAASNLAKRLQLEAPRDAIVVSPATKALVERRFDLESLGTRELKGIEDPVEVFRVLGEASDQRAFGEPLVNRDAETRQLHAAWDATRESFGPRPPERPRIVVLRGDPGIGKTRLAAALCEYARQTGGGAYEAECSPYHGNVPLWPIVRIIERFVGLRPSDPAERRAEALLARLADAGVDLPTTAPLIGQLLGLEAVMPYPLPQVDATALRTQTLWALVRWLTLVAERVPRVLRVEDLQWADPTTVELLSLLVADRPAGVLLLVTSRTPVGPLLSLGGLEVVLGPLDQSDTGELIDQRVGRVALGAEQRRSLIDRSGGNPLFAEEIARQVASDDSTTDLPLRLGELLAARVLDGELDLRLEQQAATLGVLFDRDQLEAMVGAPVGDALTILRDRGIVEPLDDPTGSSYRFTNALLRQAAYESQVDETRRENHATAARVLLGGAAARPGDVALAAGHLELARDFLNAAIHYVEAIRQAQATASHLEAIQLAGQALGAVARLPASEDRDVLELTVRMLRTLSSVARSGYGYSDVLDDFSRGEEIARALPERPEALIAQVGIWSYFIVRGDTRKAKEITDRLAALVLDPAHAWYADAAEIRTCVGYQDFYGGLLDDARRNLERSVEMYEARASDSPLWALNPLPHDQVVAATVVLACVAYLQGDVEASEAWVSRTMERARAIPFPRGPFSEAYALIYLAWLRMIAGDPAGATDCVHRLLAICRERQFDYLAIVGRAYLLAGSDDPRSVAASLEGTLATLDAIGHGAFRAAMLGGLSQCYAQAGEPDRAIALADEAVQVAERSGELLHLPELLRSRAVLRLAAGPADQEAAAADLSRAVELGIGQASYVFALRAAIGVSRLPVQVRPDNWREQLEEVAGRLSGGARLPELAEATALLASG